MQFQQYHQYSIEVETFVDVHGPQKVEHVHLKQEKSLTMIAVHGT